MAVRLITASALVAAACALPFASTAHGDVATAPIPESPCNLPNDRTLIIWHRVPGDIDRAEKISESDFYNCRPTLDTLHGPALGPTGPGYCTKLAWLSDNPGYSIRIGPAPPLKNVIDQVGDC
ncbi:hypothetical protein [Mycobacterium paraense]|uniref:hypothetical protein n=1 Tax=Mycobacterium paraense TaxID=767916 RepID=UPI00111C12AB|nr:hypothetical protein [Mycobacterium paraense]MCV7442917.1 hypothetical protein [Mycobacterium paraense]